MRLVCSLRCDVVGLIVELLPHISNELLALAGVLGLGVDFGDSQLHFEFLIFQFQVGLRLQCDLLQLALVLNSLCVPLHGQLGELLLHSGHLLMSLSHGGLRFGRNLLVIL